MTMPFAFTNPDFHLWRTTRGPLSHLQCGNNDVKNGAQSQASNPLGTWVCTCQVAFRAQCRVGNCGTRHRRPGDRASGSPCRFTVLLPNLEHNIREQSRINARTKTKYLPSEIADTSADYARKLYHAIGNLWPLQWSTFEDLFFLARPKGVSDAFAKRRSQTLWPPSAPRLAGRSFSAAENQNSLKQNWNNRHWEATLPVKQRLWGSWALWLICQYKCNVKACKYPALRRNHKEIQSYQSWAV